NHCQHRVSHSSKVHDGPLIGSVDAPLQRGQLSNPDSRRGVFNGVPTHSDLSDTLPAMEREGRLDATTMARQRSGFTMLIAAAILLAFLSGRWTIPLAAWLSPIFLLRYVRGGRALPRLALAVATLYLVGCLIWWGLVPVPAPAYFGILVAIMLPLVVPYVVDRLLVRREDGFRSKLVFASAWTVTEFLISRTSPYGSWGLVANTQVD